MERTIIVAGSDDIITGGAGNDIINRWCWFGHFNVDVGSDTIKDLSASDILASSGATANATISASYTATNLAKNDG